MKCPRRDDAFAAVSAYPLDDAWEIRRGQAECSYCGSISPEALFAAIAAGVEITPTDKSYKVYLGGSSKFYFQHLNGPQKIEFVRLLNAHEVKIGYPGYFYVLPFFCRRDAARAAAE